VGLETDPFQGNQLRRNNVDGILATVITDTVDAMCQRLARIREIRDQDPIIAKMIWGIHIEGPFLNKQAGFVGAHSPEKVRQADSGVMCRLLDAGGDLVRLVTLAPENDADCNVTKMLVKRGIRVAAGHCDPNIDQLRTSIDSGLSVFTHLGNGCPLMMHRHDNIIQRVLSVANQLWIGFIADGIHVSNIALRNYLQLAGIEHSFVVTDAIHAAGCGPGTYQFGGRTVVVDQELATWDEDHSHLAGSASEMSDLDNNLRCNVGLTQNDVNRLVSSNPRQIIGTRVVSES